MKERKKVEEMQEMKMRLKRACIERERGEEVDLRGVSIDQRKKKREWLPGLGFVKFQI